MCSDAAQLGGGGQGLPQPVFFRMLRGVGEVGLFTLDAALGIFVSWRLLRWDLRRLSPLELSRAWPDSSMWMTVVLLGLFSVPLHFIRTRRSWAGLDMAQFWFAVAFALSSLPVWGLALIFGIDE